MKSFLVFALLPALSGVPVSAQAAVEQGVTIEREVELYLADTLGKVREIHRTERVCYANGNLLIEDLTFGEKLLVRSDRQTVWIIDPLGGTYSELTFEQIRKRTDEVLGEIAQARGRVKGTRDEQELIVLLQAYGRFDRKPTAELRAIGERREIVKRACVRKDLFVNGNMRRLSVFVDPTIPDGAGYYETLGRMGALSDHERIALKEIGGFPLEGRSRWTLFLDRMQCIVKRVISVQLGDIPDGVFDPPVGLKKVPLRGFEAPPARSVKRPEGFEGSWREDDLERENNPFREGDNPE